MKAVRTNFGTCVFCWCNMKEMIGCKVGGSVAIHASPHTIHGHMLLQSPLLHQLLVMEIWVLGLEEGSSIIHTLIHSKPPKIHKMWLVVSARHTSITHKRENISSEGDSCLFSTSSRQKIHFLTSLYSKCYICTELPGRGFIYMANIV